MLVGALWPTTSSSSVVCCEDEVWQWSECGKYVVLVGPVVEALRRRGPRLVGQQQQQVTAPCTTPDGSKERVQTSDGDERRLHLSQQSST